MTEKRNLCAMIPAELHSRVRTAQEESGLTLSAYMTKLLTDYYEKGSEQTMSGVRTMAFQMPKVSQKEFVLALVRQALDEAERKEAANNGADLG